MIIRGPLIINIDSPVLSFEEKKLLKNKIIGGVILFSHNHIDFNQTKNLISDIKEIDETILICVDHEGGRVQRLIHGFELLPSFENISQDSNNKELSYEIGKKGSYDLLNVGVDINFSPVIDIYGSKNNALLKDRTFGSSINNTITLANEYIKSTLLNKIIPVLKHYPGHGVVTGDTHIEKCESQLKLDDLLDVHLKPFIELYNKYNIPIMTSHIQLSNLDMNIITYSKYWLKEIPKKLFQSKPFFISDDIEMKAALKKNNKSHNLLSALKSGCDMVIITTMQNDTVIKSKQSYEYFSKNYLTKEVIDYYEKIYNNNKINISVIK